ncbi:MAG TPA: UDP-N-acetylmuramate dehydrogenase [Actinomycetota bacterium]|jgi:UDP-N-acetylmuramate dehydrogenase
MNVAGLVPVLERRLEGEVAAGRPLAPLTTYRLGGPAALFVEPRSDADLVALAEELRARFPTGVPVLALGRGSNLVVSDDGFDGVVIRMGQAFSWIEPHGETGLDAGASTSLPLLANWAARRGLAGLEFTVAIPGSVGGAVRMNAGAHGGSVSDCLESARVFTLDGLELVRRDASTLGLSYRRSSLTENEVVVDARFALRTDDPGEIRGRMDGYRRHRAETQPGAVQNAGSVFKNPDGDSAGRLVEAAGLKGFRVGGAAVSELHANFFVAESGASAQDVFDLVKAVKEKVRDSSGVELHEEIRFVGAFASEDGRNGN